MIEEDPDMETYYEKDDGKNKTPVYIPSYTLNAIA